jgi:lysophospholipase L1-like esterase
MRSLLVKLTCVAVLVVAVPWGSLAVYRHLRTRRIIDAKLTSLHWQTEVHRFAQATPGAAPVVFLGDSLTQRFDLSTLGTPQIANRGINGDFTEGVLRRLPQIVAMKPAKVFIEIGINDLIERVPPAQVLVNYRRILESLKRELPTTQLYVQGLTPLALPSSWLRSTGALNRTIQTTNTRLASLCREEGVTWIDLYPLLQRDGRLREEYSLDGVHLTVAGYAVWRQAVAPYVNGS